MYGYYKSTTQKVLLAFTCHIIDSVVIFSLSEITASQLGEQINGYISVPIGRVRSDSDKKFDYFKKVEL